VSLVSNTSRTCGRELVVSPHRARARRNRVPAALLAVTIAITSPFLSAAQEYVPAQSRSKAAFLATFPNFVDWPDGAHQIHRSSLAYWETSAPAPLSPRSLETRRRTAAVFRSDGLRTTSRSTAATFSLSVVPNFRAIRKSSRLCKARALSPSAKRQIFFPRAACSPSHSKTMPSSSK